MKARRHVRDKSAKARRMRLEKERQHAHNMRMVTEMNDLQLLRNLDNIISKVCFLRFFNLKILWVSFKYMNPGGTLKIKMS